MYHKACRLLVRHDGYIRDLQAFRLVCYIQYYIGYILWLNSLNASVHRFSPFRITVESYFTKWSFYDAWLNGSNLNICSYGIHANAIGQHLNSRLCCTVNGTTWVCINPSCRAHIYDMTFIFINHERKYCLCYIKKS